jgi:hypothetical protein
MSVNWSAGWREGVLFFGWHGVSIAELFNSEPPRPPPFPGVGRREFLLTALELVRSWPGYERSSQRLMIESRLLYIEQGRQPAAGSAQSWEGDLRGTVLIPAMVVALFERCGQPVPPFETTHYDYMHGQDEAKARDAALPFPSSQGLPLPSPTRSPPQHETADEGSPAPPSSPLSTKAEAGDHKRPTPAWTAMLKLKAERGAEIEALKSHAARVKFVVVETGVSVTSARTFLGPKPAGEKPKRKRKRQRKRQSHPQF